MLCTQNAQPKPGLSDVQVMIAPVRLLVIPAMVTATGSIASTPISVRLGLQVRSPRARLMTNNSGGMAATAGNATGSAMHVTIGYPSGPAHSRPISTTRVHQTMAAPSPATEPYSTGWFRRPCHPITVRMLQANRDSMYPAIAPNICYASAEPRTRAGPTGIFPVRTGLRARLPSRPPELIAIDHLRGVRNSRREAA